MRLMIVFYIKPSEPNTQSGFGPGGRNWPHVQPLISRAILPEKEGGVNETGLFS